MAKSNRRPLAVFPINRLRRIEDFIRRMRAITLNILNNVVLFATPAPTLASTNTATDELETAETRAATRVTGSAAARNIKYDAVLDKMRGLMYYVQTLADNSPDEATAIAIIQASGFDLKNHGVRVKPDLAVKQLKNDPSLMLTAKSAGPRVSYEWNQSLDGTAWASLPVTLQAKTKVTTVTPGQRMYFRFRAILKDGPTSWSVIVSIVPQ